VSPRPIAGIYNLCYYWPFVRFPKTIRDQIAADPKLGRMIDGTWDMSKSTRAFDILADDDSVLSADIATTNDRDQDTDSFDSDQGLQLQSKGDQSEGEPAARRSSFDWRKRIISQTVQEDAPSGAGESAITSASRRQSVCTVIEMPQRRGSRTIVMRMGNGVAANPSQRNSLQSIPSQPNRYVDHGPSDRMQEL
jgi:hypothetical protein